MHFSTWCDSLYDNCILFLCDGLLLTFWTWLATKMVKRPCFQRLERKNVTNLAALAWHCWFATQQSQRPRLTSSAVEQRSQATIMREVDVLVTFHCHTLAAAHHCIFSHLSTVWHTVGMTYETATMQCWKGHVLTRPGCCNPRGHAPTINLHSMLQWDLLIWLTRCS